MRMMETFDHFTNFEDFEKSECKWLFKVDLGPMDEDEWEYILEKMVWRDDDRTFLPSPAKDNYVLYANEPENTISQAWKFFNRMKAIEDAPAYSS